MKVKATKIIDIDKLFKVELNKKNPIISCVSAMLGIAAGVILQALSPTVGSGTDKLFLSFYSLNSDRSIPEIFASSFVYNMFIIMLLMFLGFSAVGFALVYILPFFKGLGVGAVCSYIYSAYLFKGVAYCALFVFPVAVLQFLAIILACNESAQMSADILDLIRKNSSAEAKIRSDLYVLRYIIITAAVAVSSLIYAVCVMLFFKVSS
ncbi:MAG: stage II sporulation protein M [Acutalibacteraceae bacterium]|nr:stage II sporulation protein M [Oscillospiraceae bacterium]